MFSLHKNQSIDSQCKQVGRFLYEENIGFKWFKVELQTFNFGENRRLKFSTFSNEFSTLEKLFRNSLKN